MATWLGSVRLSAESASTLLVEMFKVSAVPSRPLWLPLQSGTCLFIRQQVHILPFTSLRQLELFLPHPKQLHYNTFTRCHYTNH